MNIFPRKEPQALFIRQGEGYVAWMMPSHVDLNLDGGFDFTRNRKGIFNDPFALDGSIVGGHESLASKEDPADEAIEGFTLVGGLKRLPEVGITEIPEYEHGPDDLAKCSQGHLEAVVATVAPQSAQEG